MSKKLSTQTSSARERLQRLTISAIFIALAVVAKSFQIPVYILGFDGMHISAAGIFSTLPALLFGPLYGGAVSGIVDVIGFFAARTAGAFNPLYTLTAILNGVLKGLLWNLFLKLKNIKNWNRVQNILLAVFGAVLLFGIGNWICISFYPSLSWSQYLLKLADKVSFITFGIMLVGGIGILCIIMARFLGRILKKENTSNILRLLATLGIANLVYTTLNTFIIIWVSSKLSLSTFWIFHTPRLIEELIMVVIQTFVIAWVLVLVRKIGGQAISKERI